MKLRHRQGEAQAGWGSGRVRHRHRQGEGQDITHVERARSTVRVQIHMRNKLVLLSVQAAIRTNIF